MALPPTAKAFDQPLDPSDELDFYVFLNQGAPDAKPTPLLLVGEGVAAYALALTAEAVAVGLEIMTGDFASQLTANELTLWLRVAASMRAATIFDGAGIVVGIELTVTTTAHRRKQRTVLVRIANQ